MQCVTYYVCMCKLYCIIQFHFISGCKTERELNISECSFHVFGAIYIDSSSLYVLVWILTITVMICNLIVCVARPFIDVNPYRDTKGIQNTEITWDVVSDRGYRYTIIDTSDNSVVERKYFVIHADLNNAHTIVTVEKDCRFSAVYKN